MLWASWSTPSVRDCSFLVFAVGSQQLHLPRSPNHSRHSQARKGWFEKKCLQFWLQQNSVFNPWMPFASRSLPVKCPIRVLSLQGPVRGEMLRTGRRAAEPRAAARPGQAISGAESAGTRLEGQVCLSHGCALLPGAHSHMGRNMNRTSWAPACSPDKCPGLLKVNLLKTRDKTSQFSPGFTTDIFGGAAVLGDTPPHSGFCRRARGRVHPAGSWRLPRAGGAAVPGPGEILVLERSRGWRDPGAGMLELLSLVLRRSWGSRGAPGAGTLVITGIGI